MNFPNKDKYKKKCSVSSQINRLSSEEKYIQMTLTYGQLHTTYTEGEMISVLSNLSSSNQIWGVLLPSGNLEA